ncbi:MAG: hypothetical protein QOC82_1348 [Frankiaceae bacterium]|jgi:hypothetical protein|nr:hypothetical protein [Frankiaceae bacterium]
MAFRNPVYLDLDLLRNLADYYGVALPTEGEVVRRVVEERGGSLGVNRVVEAKRESGSTEEVTETFTSQVRPVRALNDVIDHLLQTGDVADLTAVPDAALLARAPLQVEGDFVVSPATEMGSLVGRFLPLLIAQAAQGAKDFEMSDADAAQVLFAPPPAAHTHIYELVLERRVERLVVLVDPGHMYGSATVDDLDGELTLFGIVDRLLPEATSFSLERYFLPGLNRTLRRALSGDQLVKMLEGFGAMTGEKVDAASLSIQGPAAVVSPLAVY